jgi:DNA-binding transcriptional LysR family regulator
MAGLVRSVDLAELRAFCAAVDLGSIGGAARLLRVSQPALSKRMRALEALAGAQLLVRSPRGIATTDAGERLYVEARKLLAQAEAVEELMAGLSNEDAPVRLAVSHTIAEFVLPGRLVEYEQLRGRHLSVELVIANSVVVRELVSGGRAEFGIAAAQPGAAPPPGLKQVHFCDDEVVVAVPEGHPWAGVDEIEPEQLVEEPLVVRDPSANTRQTVDEALAARGLKLAPALAEVGSTSAAKATALSERAPVLLSGISVGRDEEGFAVKPVRGLDLSRQFVLLLAAHESLAPGARALVEHLLEQPITQG